MSHIHGVIASVTPSRQDGSCSGTRPIPQNVFCDVVVAFLGRPVSTPSLESVHAAGSALGGGTRAVGDAVLPAAFLLSNVCWEEAAGRESGKTVQLHYWRHIKNIPGRAPQALSGTPKVRSKSGCSSVERILFAAHAVPLKHLRTSTARVNRCPIGKTSVTLDAAAMRSGSAAITASFQESCGQDRQSAAGA